MGSEHDCPTPEVLSQFLAGALAPERFSGVLSHLDGCELCQSQLQTDPDLDDTLISSLRRVGTAEQDRAPGLERMLAAVEKIGREQAQGPAGTGAATPLEQTIRDYQLLERLGQGGMGDVYKALHTHLNKIVALKLLPLDRMSASSVSRFQREMRAVGKLDHPHIVRATDAGQHEGRQYLAMEYVPGCDLSRLATRIGPLPVPEACEIIRQAAIGLQHAHENGLIHRDIKPSNLMLADNGQVKILDLGLALLNDPIAEEELTNTGQMMGTADYMAPEQFNDSHSVDIRADIYALGCTLFRLLAGEAPYSGSRFRTALQKMIGHTEQPTPSIRRLRPEVPLDLDGLVQRAMSKRPEDRPATPGEFAAAVAVHCGGADLRALAGKPAATGGGLQPDRPASSVLAPTLSPRVQPGRPTLLRFAAIAAAAVLVVALGIILTLRTPHGEVVVEFADGVEPEDVKIEVSGNGALHLADAAQGWTIDVAQGRYEVKLAGGADRFDLDRNEVTVTRDGAARVRVILKTISPDDGEVAKSSTATPPAPSHNATKDGIATLDQLDPEKIPESERFDWQPAELVAVIGEHRLRAVCELACPVAFHPSGAYFVGQAQRGLCVAFSTSKLDLCPGASSNAFSAWWFERQPFSPSGTKFANLSTVGWLDPNAPADEPRMLRKAAIPSLAKHSNYPEHFNVAWLGDDFLASATDEPGLVELWDTTGESPRLQQTLRVESDLVLNQVASSSDGRRLIAFGDARDAADSDLVVGWDVDLRNPTAPMVSERFRFMSEAGILSLFLTSDGQTMFTLAGNDLKVYDLSGNTPALIETIHGINYPVAVTPDGERIACMHGGGGPAVYARRDGKYVLLADLPAIPSGVRSSLAMSPDASRLVAGAISGRIHVYDLTKSPPVELLPPPPGSSPQTPRFSPDGRYLTLDGHDESTLWDLTSAAPVRKIMAGRSSNHPVSSVNARYAVVGNRELWDLSAAPAQQVGVLDRDISRVSPGEGDELVVWSGNSVIRRSWEITRLGKFLLGPPTARKEFGEDQMLISGFRPDINRVVTLSQQKELRVWRLDDADEPLHTLPLGLEHIGEGRWLHLSNDGQLLAAWGHDRLRVWDLAEKPPRLYESGFGGGHSLAFSSTGRLAVLAGGRGLLIIDWIEGREVRGIGEGVMHGIGVAIHPDGHHVALTTANCMTYILRIPELAADVRRHNAQEPNSGD